MAKEATKIGSFGYIDGPEAAAHMDNHVTSCSGDCNEDAAYAAKLLNADALMLDGPTGHSDVTT